jgi:dTDP-4-amino-4,6-dideoxygalactose transaminase/CelD/BcsL family acetyltransferase involved in cellulose biosynthesis
MTGARLDLFPPLPPLAYARRLQARLPFPLGAPGCMLFGRARYGLRSALAGLELAEGDEVLVPAYHHGSEIEALMRAGLECRFYDATETLEPDEAELESLLDSRTRALYLIHYLGFPQDAERWRSWCDERGLLLIEDGAQAWLARSDYGPVGSIGDLALFCLYKTFGVPDGAAVFSVVQPEEQTDQWPLGLGRLARRHASWFAARSRMFGTLTSPLRQQDDLPAERELAWLPEESPPSSTTVFLLPRIADPSAAAQRRANYRVLLDDLGELVPPTFAELPAGASPLWFPIDVEKAGPKLAQRLESNGIEARPAWTTLHRSFPARRFPGAASWRARLVGVPVHQELRRRDVERIAAVARGRSKRPRVLDLEPTDELEPLREEWERLALASGNIFATPEWANSWWRHFGGEAKLLLTTCRSRDGALLGLLPLYRWAKRPARVLRFLGHSAGDQLGPLCSPQDRPAVARSLRRAIATGPLRCDVLMGEQLPADEGWSALLGAKTLTREGTPMLRFRHDSWEGFLGSLSARLRHEIRHDERKLAERHELTYRLADDPARLQDDLGVMFALHNARWGDKSVFAHDHQPFHRDFAACALERGWLRLWLLELDGKPVAAWYGFRFCGIESFYQAGRDPEWQRSSVGLVLMVHTMRSALEDGAREYRFLRGGEGYKYRFADEDRGLVTIALPTGATGSTAVAGALALRNARRGYRAAQAAARRRR